MAVKACMNIGSAIWTEKTEFLFFLCVSFYFTSSEFLHQYQNYYILTVFFIRFLTYFSSVNIDIYKEIYLDIFPSDGLKWITKREKTRDIQSNHKTFFVWRTWSKNLKHLYIIWWKIKKKQGLVKSKYQTIT